MPSSSVRRSLPPLLAGALCSALLLSATTARAGDGQALLELLPSGVQAVTVVNVEQARRSPLYGKLLGLVRGQAQFAGLLAEIEQTTGLKPERDLQTVLIASQPGSRYRLRGFVLLQGKFQQPRIEKKLAEDGRLKPETRAGRKVWSKTGRGTVFDLVFLRPDLLGLIHPSLLEELTGRLPAPAAAPQAKGAAKGAAPVAAAVPPASFSSELQALLARPDRTASVWFAGRVPPELRGNPEAGPLAQADGGFGSLRLGSELVGTLTGVFRDEATAQNLSAMLMMLRTRIASRAQVKALGLEPVVTRLSAVPQGKEATVQLQISGPELTDIATKATAFLAELQVRRQAAARTPTPAATPAAAPAAAPTAAAPAPAAPAAAPTPAPMPAQAPAAD